MGDFRIILGEIAPVFGLGIVLEAARLFRRFQNRAELVDPQCFTVLRVSGIWQLA